MKAFPQLILVFLCHAGATLLAVLFSFRSAVGGWFGHEATRTDRLLEGASLVLRFPVLAIAERLELNLLQAWLLYASIALNSLLWTVLLWALYSRYVGRGDRQHQLPLLV